MVGDVGVVEGEIWYLRLEGILYIWEDESMSDMGEMGQWTMSQGGLWASVPKW